MGMLALPCLGRIVALAVERTGGGTMSISNSHAAEQIAPYLDMLFAQVFDDKNSISSSTEGGHVEETDGVTRWKRHRPRQAGARALVFCLGLVLRFTLDILITRLVSKA
jgi:hypothetical protein